MKIDTKWLEQAMTAIENGLANKLEKDGVIIYRCGTIIRIDVKGVFKDYK
jgi:hypothetical protein